MRKFKVGDPVVLTESGINRWDKFDSNPPNTRGRITGFDEWWTFVEWDNGFTNSYYESDLAHYGQTLAELNVKAGDVVEMMTCDDADYIGSICDINSSGHAVSRGGGRFHDSFDEYYARTWRIISRAMPQPNWLPCPPDYRPQDNHEVTYHMGVPTHYYVTEPVLVDVEERVDFNGDYMYYHGPKQNATLRGKTKDGKPVGQWTIDMDDDQ